MGYPIRKWNDVLSIISGKNQKVVADSSGQYPIYGSGGIMGYANNYLCEAGTTIIGRKGTINRPIFVNERFWNVDTAFGVFPGEMLHPKFLFYFCQSFNFKALDKSTTIPSLAKRDLLNIEMPVPSFSEQEHIISRIEELFSQLDASVAELKTAKERLKVYRQAVLKEAFAKFHAFTSLKQASERIFDGPFGSNLKTADYVEQGVRVVRLENVKNAWFDNAKRSFVTREKYQTISSHTVYPDDLIMSTFISEDIKICQLPVDVGFAVNKADCIGIRLKSGINPRFVMFYLASREAYNALIHQVHGATRPRVNTKQIKAMQIPVAKLREQDITVIEIEEKMSICDSIEKTVDTALQQAEALRQSILKKVCRTVYWETGGGLTAGDTKTSAGVRKIVLPASTVQVLRERKKSALTEWIFPNPLKPEQPTNPGAAYRQLKALLKRAGLPNIRFHDLRHTFATYALASGVDVKTLSGILGHTRAAFTLDTYTHTTGDMQKRASEVVGDFLTDIFGEELRPWEESAKAARVLSD